MGSTLTVDNIVGATTAANVKLPAGTVLQTVSGTFSDGFRDEFEPSRSLNCVLSPRRRANFHIFPILEKT